MTFIRIYFIIIHYLYLLRHKQNEVLLTGKLSKKGVAVFNYKNIL